MWIKFNQYQWCWVEDEDYLIPEPKPFVTNIGSGLALPVTVPIASAMVLFVCAWVIQEMAGRPLLLRTTDTSTRWPTHWIICYLLHRGLMELLRPYYLLSVMVFIQRRTTVRWSWFSSRSHWGKRWSRRFYWYDGEHLPSATELWVLLEMVPSEKQGISESWWWTLPVQVSSRIAR